MKAVSLIVATAVLAGCAAVGSDSGERRVTYVCNYGGNLTVTYGRSVARIESEDGTVTLQQRRAASGFWYESATHALRGKGGDITYTDRQMAPRECHEA